ncbi:MAG: hypothetical protein U9O94_11555 [Nanoarchaeota archaeon]|nr:hypothetical protein [Nanoarchaeota archaeon]
MHNKYIFSNILGTFVFNEHFNILDRKLFSNSEQYINKEKTEKEFSNKYKNLKKPERKELKKILLYFNNRQFFNDFYKRNIELTKKEIRNSVKDDLLIMQTINNLNDLDKVINIMIKRLREWYSLHNPEFSHSLKNQESFVDLILKKQKKELLKELNKEETMGADFSKEDLEPIMDLAKEVSQLYQLRNKQENYLEELMKKVAPNLLAIAGAKIGARLIEQAGSLKSLMLFPASTIQLLGAEKALFRHMKTKAKAPKYGFIREHPLISKNPRQLHGKIARTLADKLCLAIKVDYFKGEFIGDKLLKEVEAKFK